MRASPADARAPYYLGNLLYDVQPQSAVQWWEKAASMDGSLAMVHRNLAFAYEHTQNQTAKAIASMEKAVALDKNNPRFYYELDRLYEAGNVSPQKRLAAMSGNPAAVAKRSDGLMQQTKVYLLLGQYDQAVELLNSHRFHNWEGEGDIHDVYMDAQLLRGQKRAAAGKYQEALKDYEASLMYPENLEVGKPYHQGRLPEVYWLMGRAYEKLGEPEKARELFQQAATTREHDPAMRYYQGLAAQKLGQKEEAERLFRGLIDAGEKELTEGPEINYFAKFGRRQPTRTRLADAHYLIALGNLGIGKLDKAAAEFREALKLDANHLGATTRAAELETQHTSRP